MLLLTWNYINIFNKSGFKLGSHEYIYLSILLSTMYNILYLFFTNPTKILYLGCICQMLFSLIALSNITIAYFYIMDQLADYVNLFLIMYNFSDIDFFRKMAIVLYMFKILFNGLFMLPYILKYYGYKTLWFPIQFVYLICLIYNAIVNK